MNKNFIYLLIITAILVCIVACGHLNEAKKSYNNNNYDETIAYCKQALEKDPADTEAMVLMGKCYRQKELLNKALDITQKAYQLKPAAHISHELLRIHNAIGDKNLEHNNNKALIHYQAALEINPANLHAQKKIAYTYYLLGELKKARSYYQELSKRKNETSVTDMITDINKRIEKSRTIYEKGRTQYRQSRLKNARYYFEQASEQYSGSEEINYHLYLTRGRILYEKGSVSELWDAIELFGKATVLQNKQGEPWYWMGLAYNKKDKNEFTNAIDCLTRALELELNPDLTEKCSKKLQEIKQRKKKMDEFWGRE